MCYLTTIKLASNSLQTGNKLVGLNQKDSLHSIKTRTLKQYRYAAFRWFPLYPPNDTLFIMAHSLPNPSQPLAKKAHYTQSNSPWSNNTAMLPSGGSPLTLLTLRYPTAGIRSRKLSPALPLVGRQNLTLLDFTYFFDKHHTSLVELFFPLGRASRARSCPQPCHREKTVPFKAIYHNEAL